MHEHERSTALAREYVESFQAHTVLADLGDMNRLTKRRQLARKALRRASSGGHRGTTRLHGNEKRKKRHDFKLQSTPGAEGVGQKIKTQKEVRFDTTKHIVGRREEAWGRRGDTQREVRFDLAEYTGGRRGSDRRGKTQKDTSAVAAGRRAPPSAAGHRRRQIAVKNLAFQNPLAVATSRFFTAAACIEGIQYYCCFCHRSSGTAQRRRTQGATE